MLHERKSSSKYAKSAFFEGYNDIDIYIEDTADGYAKLFKHLFKRVFEGVYQINNIYPIGSRNIVIDRCKSEADSIKRNSLFIVDGDLYSLKGEPKKIPDGVFVLPRYCIENILIDEDSICKLLDEENIEKDISQLYELFDFGGWREHNKKYLVPLFIEYAIAQKLSTPIKTIKYKVSKLILEENGLVDGGLVHTRISEVKEHSINHAGEVRYNKEKILIEASVDHSDCSLLKYVSGKDYLMPLLMHKLRKLVSSCPSNINIRQRVAMKCDINLLLPAKQFVLNTSKNS